MMFRYLIPTLFFALPWLPLVLTEEGKIPCQSFAEAIELLQTQTASPEESHRPVCIYMGSKKNSFYKGVLRLPKVAKALNSVIFVQVSMSSDIPYPLTGAPAKGEDLANLLGAPAGSVVFLDTRGVLIPNLTTTHLTLGNDSKLFLDLLSYVVSGRYKHLSIQEHAVVSGTQQLWFSALERGRKPLPMTKVTQTNIMLVNAETGAARRLQDLKRHFVVVSRTPLARTSTVMLGELTQAFKHSGLRVALAAPVGSKVLQLKKNLPALEIYYLDAKDMETTGPSTYFIGAETIIRFDGYVPAPLIASLFKIPLAQGFKLLDRDLPVGEREVKP
ncbi:hypothetical protein JYT83_00270 [bacterium AH-315-F18]|nr:hypothetical protein [bacterium AH-315-F18]